MSLLTENLVTNGKLDNGFSMAFPAYVPSGVGGGGGPTLDSGHLFLTHTPTPLGLNPIDRLYSMQTSYFCGEEAAMLDHWGSRRPTTPTYTTCNIVLHTLVEFYTRISCSARKCCSLLKKKQYTFINKKCNIICKIQ